MSENNQENFKNQQRNLIIFFGIFCVVCWGIYALLTHANKPKVPQKVESNFTSPIANIDAESVILTKTQAKQEEIERKTDELHQKFQAMERTQTSKEQVTAAQNGVYDQVNGRLSKLEQQLEQLLKGSKSLSGALKNNFAAQENGQLASPSSGIRSDDFQLAPSSVSGFTTTFIPSRNPDTYVPAGTFARAVMIGGADVSAAVNAQANPTPMLFRITAAGTLPNHMRSKLRDCVVTAAAVGDISSERGLIRLETLSCTKPDGEVMDTPVEGTIFGPEGKNGIRGKPVWRESALLQRAFAAGALSGFSNALSQKYTTTSVSALGSTQSVAGADVWKMGAAGGAGNAMNKLAEYNIQRAEQYHPVIQLAAGTVVDVVFLKGFYLDGRKHPEETAATTNTPAPATPPQPLFNPPDPIDKSAQPIKLSPLPLTPKQIQRLREHSRELGFRTDGTSEEKQQ